jgi:hypothetical protein
MMKGQRYEQPRMLDELRGADGPVGVKHGSDLVVRAQPIERIN